MKIAKRKHIHLKGLYKLDSYSQVLTTWDVKCLLQTEKKDERYGTPNSGYDWSTEARPEPVYEMFRVPSTSTVPKAATYLNPHTSTRNVPG